MPPSPAMRPWLASDVRMLDAPSADNHFLDLTAIYTRQAGSDLEIRLDLLDMDALNPAAGDLYIALDYVPGGSDTLLLSPEAFKAKCVCTLTQAKIEWDMLIVVPANSAPRVFLEGQASPSEQILPRVARDPGLDTITVSLNRASLPDFALPPKIEVFITPPGSYESADRLGPVSMDASLRQRVPVLLAFWNTFEAPTPALALRRWDGAHTGPLGGRHGLRHLLEAAEANRIPVALLDIKNPASLAALEAVGGVERLQALLDQDLLILPETAYGEPASAALKHSRKAARDFGLPASLAAYGSTDDPLPGYRYRFISLPGIDQPVRQNGVTLLPLPVADERLEPTPDGPSLELRRALLEAALSADPARTFILGGDLRQSTWGSPEHARPTLAYFAARPYLHALSENDLLTIATPVKRVETPPVLDGTPPAVFTSQGVPTRFDAHSLRQAMLARLEVAPSNPIGDSAQEMYFALTAPTTNTALASLRAQYLGDVGILVEAARWAESPRPRADCTADPDLDGMAECMLASEQYFAVLEPDGARLAYFFAGFDQLVGPTWQFAAGVSDPRTWDPSRGPAADPAQVPGAFADSDKPFELHQTNGYAQDVGVIFSRLDGTGSKTFRLGNDGLEVRYMGNLPERTRLSLVVSPERRFQPGWLSAYQWLQEGEIIRWGPESGTGLSVQAEGLAESRRFNDSLAWMTSPEDPDRSYPAGHTLPFPVALLEIKPSRTPILLSAQK